MIAASSKSFPGFVSYLRSTSWYGRSTGNLTAFPEPVCAPSANAVPGQGSRRCFSYPPPWGDMSFRFSPCRRWVGMLACFPAASAMGGRLRLAVLGTLHRFRRLRLLAGVGQNCSPFPSLVRRKYQMVIVWSRLKLQMVLFRA